MTAARRYAEALLESVWTEESAEQQDEAAQALQRLAQAINEVFDLQNALENPSYSSDERLKALNAVMSQLQMSERTQTFARLVVERGRAQELSIIAETFVRLLDERRGRQRAIITSAQALSEENAQQIQAALEKRTGHSVELDFSVDPSLIGGIRAQVGSLVFDGSIRAELDRLREQLSQSS